MSNPDPPRFVCLGLPAEPGRAVALDPDQARHARKALRLSDGDAVLLIDGRGNTAHATLLGDDPRSARCRVDALDHTPRPSPAVELATAIPKGPRGDAMVNDLAQLGVDRLIPLITERSVVDPRPAKLGRFEKAAAEAAKQSGRAWFMRVDTPTAFTDALACDAGLRLVADPRGGPVAGLADRLDSVSVVRVLIGPEGGLTGAELDAARDAGFVPWRFNANTLRVETAAAAAVAILRCRA